VELGDPRSVLIEAARREKSDLLVIGSHGRSGMAKLLLGSVASHVVGHAPCSVLVVKRPA
jgi:nucleotide-binding universal stress UspA family protein